MAVCLPTAYCGDGMSSFFEPDPVVLAFFFVKKFVWLEVLALLAALRVIMARGPARIAGVMALALCLAGIATVFAPALGASGPIYARAAQSMALGGGMVALLAPSVPLAASAVMRGRRWWGLDALHVVLLAGLLGVWWWIS